LLDSLLQERRFNKDSKTYIDASVEICTQLC